MIDICEILQIFYEEFNVYCANKIRNDRWLCPDLAPVAVAQNQKGNLCVFSMLPAPSQGLSIFSVASTVLLVVSAYIQARMMLSVCCRISVGWVGECKKLEDLGPWIVIGVHSCIIWNTTDKIIRPCRTTAVQQITSKLWSREGPSTLEASSCCATLCIDERWYVSQWIWTSLDLEKKENIFACHKIEAIKREVKMPSRQSW